ncbi:MAG: hypothetical protein QOF49_622 [Chloroflexota bacterium]|nr:hypothetical protein [Chloroflexota bacterium]
MDDPLGLPPEALLADVPPPIRRTAERLRAIVRRALPDAVECVRPGWHLIGYDVPVGRRTRYVAWILPEPKHIHLGFEHGILLADPKRRLRGAHLELKRVRFLTFRPTIDIPDRELVAFLRGAADVALLPPAIRTGLAREAWANAGEDALPDDD